MDRKIKYNNTIVDYSEELIEKLNKTETDYEIGYICKDCGCFTPEDNTTFVTPNNGYEYPVCEDCITNSESYFFCDDCNYWYDDTVNYYTTHDDRIVCYNCRCDHYTECRDCGELFDENNNAMYYWEECNEWYCESCWDDHCHNDNLLYGYHEYNDWQVQHTPNEQPPFYIGHELEIDDGSLCYEVTDLITSKIPAICMHDGSLSDDGIEIVSQPMSYNYILSKENDYRDLFTSLTEDYNYKSHNTDTCGLHFHVTRPSDETIDRILLFMETYKEEIIRLSRRRQSEIEDWCNFLSDTRRNATTKEIKSLDYIKKNKETSTRYMALNLTNYNTIEFRIFKGTLNYDTFMADLEFVYNLVTLCSDLSLPIEEITWSRVVSMGKFLPTYIISHNLQSDKPIIDYSLEIITEKNKYIDNLRLNLNDLYKEILTKLNKLTHFDNRKKNIEYIDISRLNTYTTWLQSIVNDIKFGLNEDSSKEHLNEIEKRIKYIKERMI